MSTVVVAVERNEIENLYKIFFLNDKVRVKMTTILQDKKKKTWLETKRKEKTEQFMYASVFYPGALRSTSMQITAIRLFTSWFAYSFCSLQIHTQYGRICFF